MKNYSFAQTMLCKVSKLYSKIMNGNKPRRNNLLLLHNRMENKEKIKITKTNGGDKC